MFCSALPIHERCFAFAQKSRINRCIWLRILKHFVRSSFGPYGTTVGWPLITFIQFSYIQLNMNAESYILFLHFLKNFGDKSRSEDTFFIYFLSIVHYVSKCFSYLILNWTTSKKLRRTKKKCIYFLMKSLIWSKFVF